MEWVLHRLEGWTFLGATIEQWGVALVVALVTYTVLRIVLGAVTHRLRKLAERSANTIDDDIVTVLASTNRGLLALMSLLIGIGVLDLSGPWHERLNQLWFLALVLQAGLWGSKGVSLFLAHYLHRHEAANPAQASATSTLMSWGLRTVLWVIVVLAILSNLGVNITAFVASLGVGGIAVALAVQNILGDLFASLSIAIDKPFEVGDFVVVNGTSGTIEMVGLKSTRIRSLGGEQVVMSNTDLLKQTISNYKRLQERRVVYPFGVTYDTTPEQAERIPKVVEDIVRARDKLRFDRAHLMAFGDSSLDYEVVFYVLDPDYNVYMNERQVVNLELMKALAAMGVDFAFPTRTLHLASVPANVPANVTVPTEG
jgi:small-conductance mechanosensitive channel